MRKKNTQRAKFEFRNLLRALQSVPEALLVGWNERTRMMPGDTIEDSKSQVVGRRRLLW